MKRNIRADRTEARKTVLRRRNRETMKYVCCNRCLKRLPGRHSSDTFRTTDNAAALRDQALNS